MEGSAPKAPKSMTQAAEPEAPSHLPDQDAGGALQKAPRPGHAGQIPGYAFRSFWVRIQCSDCCGVHVARGLATFRLLRCQVSVFQASGLRLQKELLAQTHLEAPKPDLSRIREAGRGFCSTVAPFCVAPIFRWILAMKRGDLSGAADPPHTRGRRH